MVAEVRTSCKLCFFLLEYVDLIIFIFKCILHSFIHLTSEHKPVNNNPYLSNTKLSPSFLKIRISWPLFQECSVLKKNKWLCKLSIKQYTEDFILAPLGPTNCWSIKSIFQTSNFFINVSATCFFSTPLLALAPSFTYNATITIRWV